MSSSLTYVHPKWIHKFLKPKLKKPYTTPEQLVTLANELAEQNILHKTGGPFGAIILDQTTNKIVGYGVNTSLKNGSIFHAETTAIWDTLTKLNIANFKQHPHKFTIAISSSPCCMCFGAILWSGLSTIIIGANTEDVEKIGFDEGPTISIKKECSKRNITLINNINQIACIKTLIKYKKNNGKLY